MNEVDTQETGASYSLRNVDTDMTEMQRVVEENERLQKLVGSLNAQLRASAGRGKREIGGRPEGGVGAGAGDESAVPEQGTGERPGGEPAKSL